MNPFSKATQNPYVSQFVPLPTKEIGEAFANVEKNYQVGVQAKDQLDVMMASDSYIPGSQDEIEAKKQQDGIRTEIDNLSKQYLTSQIAPHIKKLALQYTTNSDLAKRRQNKKSYDEYVTEVRKSKIPNKEDYIRRSVEDYDATGEWNPINVVGNVDSNTKMSQIATANDLFSTQGYTYNGISDGRVGKFKETRLVSNDVPKAKQTIKTGLLQDTEVMEYYNSEARLQGLTNPSDIADYTNAQIDGRVNEFVTNQFLQNVKTDFEEISLDFGRRGTNKSGNTVVKEAKELVDGFITFKGAGNNGLEQGVKKEGVIQLSTTDAEIKNFDKLAKETDLAITQASKPEYQGLYLEVRNKTKEK